MRLRLVKFPPHPPARLTLAHTRAVCSAGLRLLFSILPHTVIMARCCKQSAEEPQPFVGSKHRHCTDLPCCLAFLIFWLGMVVIAIVGLAYGRPESLLYGTDYQGNTCGSSGTAGNYIYYPKLTEDLAAAAASGQTDITSMSFFGVCLDACPAMGDVTCTAEGAVALAQYVTRSTWNAPGLLEWTLLPHAPASSFGQCCQLVSSCYGHLAHQDRASSPHALLSRPRQSAASQVVPPPPCTCYAWPACPLRAAWLHSLLLQEACPAEFHRSRRLLCM